MTITKSNSTGKVPYDLRPGKQIERRMILAYLQTLMSVGIDIAKYKYIGMGSIQFIDFIMMHKYLGNTDLLSVEHDEELEARVNYNKPFGCVEIEMTSIGTTIARLDRDKQHIIWLDFDDKISLDICDDLATCGTILAPGSIIICTLDIEEERNKPKETFDRYKSDAEQFFDPRFKRIDFSSKNIPVTISKIANNAICRFMNRRIDLEYTPLFSCTYSDGHRMLSFGGMITNSDLRATLRNIELQTIPFCISSFEEMPFKIPVPVLTRLERIKLDSIMPDPTQEQIDQLPLPDSDVLAYKEIYKYLPSYIETYL